MEGSSKPETAPPGLGRADSFLTAARFVRRGWTEDGKKTGCQLSYFDRSARPDGSQGPKRAEVCPKDPRGRLVFIVSSRKTTEDRETRSDKKADEAKQTSEGRQAERQTGQAGVVCVWAPGCRTTCRQSRRFKAPILPVIAEM